MQGMRREIYDEDHEAFRGSVKEFLDREVVPHLDEHASSHGLPRDFWLAAANLTAAVYGGGAGSAPAAAESSAPSNEGGGH